jgi:hypothetical protein
LYRWIITLRTSVNPAEERWVSLAQEDPLSSDTAKVRRLGVEVSLAHPFSLLFLGAHNENVELLLRFGTALAISLVLTEDSTGESPGTVLHHLNQLLRGPLSEETQL